MSSQLAQQLDAVEPAFVPLDPEAYRSLASMEGLYDPIVERAPAAGVEVQAVPALWPGYVVATAVGAGAYGVHFLPLAPFTVEGAAGARHPISAAIIAICAGLLMSNVLRVPAGVLPGCKKIIKKLIPVAIVLTGAGLNLTVIASIGMTALVITVLCIAVAIAGSYYIGRWFGLGPRTAMLIGAGTGICGNSAIVAVAPLVDAEEDDLVLSIGTINLFALLTMLVFPLVGAWLNLDDAAFAVWSGTSIHAVPQVVTAGFAYSLDAGTLATLVKLARVTLLAPMMLVLALIYARKKTLTHSSKRKLVVNYTRLVPWFVWGFVALALLNTLGLIPDLSFKPVGMVGAGGDALQLSMSEFMTRMAKILLTVSMAAIGLGINLRQLSGVGARALTTGFAASVLLAVASLVLIYVLM